MRLLKPLQIAAGNHDIRTGLGQAAGDGYTDPCTRVRDDTACAGKAELI